MQSPFKFLDAYTLQDQDIFFGREEEVAELYQMVNKNRLILTYGQSGTGKTSLVQCGLASQFDVTDWYPLFIRRGENLNDSLRQSLTRVLGEFYEDHIETIDEIYANFLRPIYLIFDQLEELFILGDKVEQEAFIRTIRDILAANLPCRILFVLREEYLAHLYGFERVIPTLFDRRLRVEPMNYTNVSTVITKSCAKFNIQLEEPAENVDQIIRNVSSGNQGVQLPYLQVYLDRLYREDFARSYPESAVREKLPEPLPPLRFTTAEIEELGAIEGVLDDFLAQQEAPIQQALSDIPERAVERVLDAFVTTEGTKLPLTTDQLHLPGLKKEQLLEILGLLEDVRIVRRRDESFELAHDTLAAVIAGRRSAEDKTFREMIDLIRRRHRDYEKGIGSLLNRNQVQLIGNFEDKIEAEGLLEDEESAFVDKSRRVLRRNGLLWRGGVLVAFAILIWVILVFRNQSIEYQKRYKEATVAQYQRLVESGRRAAAGLEFQEAVAEFDSALQIVETYNAALNDPIRLGDEVEDARILREESMTKAARKDEFLWTLDRVEVLRGYDNQVDSLLQARRLVEEAMAMDIDSTRVANEKNLLKVVLDRRYEQLLEAGSRLYNIGTAAALRQAIRYYEDAQRIRSSLEIEERINECQRLLAG